MHFDFRSCEGQKAHFLQTPDMGKGIPCNILTLHVKTIIFSGTVLGKSLINTKPQSTILTEGMPHIDINFI